MTELSKDYLSFIIPIYGSLVHNHLMLAKQGYYVPANDQHLSSTFKNLTKLIGRDLIRGMKAYTTNMRNLHLHDVTMPPDIAYVYFSLIPDIDLTACYPNGSLGHIELRIKQYLLAVRDNKL